MRKHIVTALVFAALLSIPATAQEVTGFVQVGGHADGTSGSPDRAAEYRSIGSGADEKLNLTLRSDWIFVNIASKARNTDEQAHSLTFDLGRMVRSHTVYTRMPHRLEHDSLANLRGVVGEVKVTGSTDLDPGTRYGIRYDNFTNRNDFQIPALGWLTLTTDYREQWREGHKQSLSLSHCSTCHVQSQGRAIEEHTRDAGLQARATFGKWSVTGVYSERDSGERATDPTRVYELVEQPALRRPLFNDRMQYWSKDGALPYDVTPDTEKKLSRLEIANADLGGFAIAVAGVSSEITNLDTENKVDYDAVSFNLARKVGKSGNFTLRGRSYSIDSTDYFVDTVEPVAVAGTYPGQTYRQRYNYDPDFLRQSAIDRNVIEAQARYQHRLGKGGTLAASYDARSIDRDNYYVAPGETTTMEQKLKLTWSARPAQGFSLRAAATFADISHPFMSLDAACNPDALQTTSLPSPLAPGSVQYYQIHEARVADLSASPSQYLEARLTGTYQLGASSMAMLSYRYWDGQNDELDLTDWSKQLNAVTATISVAPAEKSELHVAATWAERELETHVCIPLMDG
jgi:hypothetical protein